MRNNSVLSSISTVLANIQKLARTADVFTLFVKVKLVSVPGFFRDL